MAEQTLDIQTATQAQNDPAKKKWFGIEDWGLAQFALLIAMSAWATYFAPKFISTAFYVTILALYYRSKNEGMWLALFLVLSDGFWGFFNNYEAVLSVIPGLPPVEIGHFYIILTVVKAAQRKPTFKPFFNPILAVLTIYLLFLIAQGYAIGLKPALNVQFRLLKFIFPLLLFYSLPRLMNTAEDYYQCFRYILPLAFTTLFAQLFTITAGITPAQLFGLRNDAWFLANLERGVTYRGFYSTSSLLAANLGGLYYLADREKRFPDLYLYGVLIANFFSAYLSATRGWVLALSAILALSIIFIFKLTPKRTLALTAGFVGLVAFMLTNPVLNKQLTGAYKRMMTLQALAHGDATAGGTLTRLTQRGPLVMNVWSDSKLTGWGFSDKFFASSDMHVANQNILLHSGIIGMGLIVFFFGYFSIKMVQSSLRLPRGHPLKEALLVFPVYLVGWLLVHSTSTQIFGYYMDPNNGIQAALFFGLAAVAYRDAFSNPAAANLA